MITLSEEHFELHVQTKIKDIRRQLRDTLREILKVYHYESEESNMSKDVVTELENLAGYLK